MCGIVSVVSERPLFKQAFQALQSLEYRGYDSFGFGALDGADLRVVKRTGPISETDVGELSDFDGARTIIGHTRWATHGGVEEKNSHPHCSHDGSVAIVHNGVIANYALLAAEHPEWELASSTDTEAAANLIADELKRAGGDLVKALGESLKRLEGEFAICGMVRGAANQTFALKRKSPLAVGRIEDGVVLSSDRIAFSSFAKSVEILHLEDNCIFLYRDGEVALYALEHGSPVEIPLNFVREEIEEQADDLEGHPHFMIKEINESERVVREAVAALEPCRDEIVHEMLVSDVSMTGSGSAYYVTMIGQYFFSSIAGAYIPTYPSDEFLNLKRLSRRDLVLAVSQSGETFDTLEVLRHGKANLAGVASINNTRGSSMQRLADYPVFQNAGKEVCVLSTKSVTSQVSILYLLATELGKRTGQLSEEAHAGLLKDFEKLPEVLRMVIAEYSAEIKRVAYQNCNIAHWFFIGRGAQYPVSLESALKFKEVSYLHAEGMPAGFFKHGTISLIDDHFYTVVFLPSPVNDPDLYQATIDNIYEIKARGGNVIGIGHAVPKSVVEDLFFEYIALPDINKHLNILVQLVAGQLLAYYSAVALGRNIDKPRALAKSVTVR